MSGILFLNTKKVLRPNKFSHNAKVHLKELMDKGLSFIDLSFIFLCQTFRLIVLRIVKSDYLQYQEGDTDEIQAWPVLVKDTRSGLTNFDDESMCIGFKLNQIMGHGDRSPVEKPLNAFRQFIIHCISP